MTSGRKVEAGREGSFLTFPSQLEDVDVGAKANSQDKSSQNPQLNSPDLLLSSLHLLTEVEEQPFPYSSSSYSSTKLQGS